MSLILLILAEQVDIFKPFLFLFLLHHEVDECLLLESLPSLLVSCTADGAIVDVAVVVVVCLEQRCPFSFALLGGSEMIILQLTMPSTFGVGR